MFESIDTLASTQKRTKHLKKQSTKKNKSKSREHNHSNSSKKKSRMDSNSSAVYMTMSAKGKSLAPNKDIRAPLAQFNSATKN